MSISAKRWGILSARWEEDLGGSDDGLALQGFESLGRALVSAIAPLTHLYLDGLSFDDGICHTMCNSLIARFVLLIFSA